MTREALFCYAATPVQVFCVTSCTVTAVYSANFLDFSSKCQLFIEFLLMHEPDYLPVYISECGRTLTDQTGKISPPQREGDMPARGAHCTWKIHLANNMAAWFNYPIGR